MARGKVFIYLFTILFSLALTYAQDATASAVDSDVSSSEGSSPQPSQPPHRPSHPPHGGSGSPGLSDLFPFSSNFPFFQIPPFFGGSRHKRSVAPTHENEIEAEQHDRFFFSLLTRRLIPCNYETDGGSRCTACKVMQRCYPGNMGTVRTCTWPFAYCNNGRCSMTQGALCRASTSTTTAASTSTDTTVTTEASTSTTPASTSTTAAPTTKKE